MLSVLFCFNLQPFSTARTSCTNLAALAITIDSETSIFAGSADLLFSANRTSSPIRGDIHTSVVFGTSDTHVHPRTCRGNGHRLLQLSTRDEIESGHVVEGRNKGVVDYVQYLKIVS